jgi:hypothetical protein
MVVMLNSIIPFIASMERKIPESTILLSRGKIRIRAPGEILDDHEKQLNI